MTEKRVTRVLPNDVRDRALAEYHSGASAKEVADKYGVSKLTVYGWASRLGVKHGKKKKIEARPEKPTRRRVPNGTKLIEFPIPAPPSGFVIVMPIDMALSFAREGRLS